MRVRVVTSYSLAHSSIVTVHRHCLHPMRSHSDTPESRSVPTSPPDVSMGRRILARGSAARRYTLRFASSVADVHAAQTLRFLVFNLELQEGLESSFLTFRDEDAFDGACTHLLVEAEGEVVGTYRMQTGIQAAKHFGYYSAQEFDLSPFEPLRPQVLELGRACVHQNHRNLSVLSMLWKGIAAYSREHGCRYLLGCSSLTSQEASEGIAMYEVLAEHHLAPEHLLTRPLPGWECALAQDSVLPVAVPKVPKLLNAYLSLGAKICAPPAMDKEFKTIDFLTLLDLETLPPSAAAFLA